MKYIGSPVRRVEDPRFVKGRGRYVDDLWLPGMLHLAVLRSPYARARFKVFTDAITGEHAKDFVSPNFFAPLYPKERVLPLGQASYYGEPVALVLGRDPYEARDALDDLEVEWDPLPPVLDPEEALNADPIHPDVPNLVYRDQFFYGEFREGDKLEKSFRYNRQSPSPIEPNAVVADYDPHGGLTVYANTQVPQVFRTALAVTFGLPRSRVTLKVPDSGGGFGGKIFIKPILLATLASMVSGRPVKYVETRTEHLVAAVHGPDRRYRAVLHHSGEKVLGLEVELLEDFGAYLHTYQPLPVLRQIYHLAGAYDVKFVSLRVKGVLTNKAPTGPYRGLGIPPAVLVLENLVSSLARKVGVDQFQVRESNLIRRTPFNSITGAVYDSGDYLESLRRLAREVDRGRRGLGVAFALEPGSSLAFQTLVVKSPRTPYYEGAYVKMDSSGEVVVTMSTNSMGTGHETAISQVVADTLGVDMDSVLVRLGDSDGPPGTGFYGSRFSVVSISAVYVAALKLRERMRTVASKLFNVEASQVEFRDGTVYVGSRKLSTVRELANAAYNRSHFLGLEEVGLEASAVINSPNVNVADESRRVNFSSTYGVNAHAVLVDVDEDTGEVRILKYVVLSDCGNMINPALVDGQLTGGTVMGLGAALSEKVTYDGEGIPMGTNFSDYRIPRAAEVPRLSLIHQVSPSPFTPLGTKGVAEGGATVPPAALINAVEDALGTSFDRVEIPLTREQVLALLEKSKSRR
ncbi:carbon-monoxide dehydrogenase large subunit [Sulfodiicoccus acidiphilus]|uniref:Carbon-monoxide dehydrogenase large subunit n=1 Tax=Sulfodiicoccus acidiphilus TaxID=1670455 RepID=A0A830H345_9CREN|nr:xanthine dehydrogenase family protein molybdopterin-binding subunit [Sulfodiicoccus acidiphilus]GGU00825.1 carbon-monoxide dehydrogenase large subunit [Sulfodiicoccus acidiphilus]